VSFVDVDGVTCGHGTTAAAAGDELAVGNDTGAASNPATTTAALHPLTLDGTLFGGDLVLASTKGYWTAWSQGDQVRLAHFTTGPSDTTIRTPAASHHPHLVGYGTGRMLLACESGSSMAAQVYDAGKGTAVGSRFTINVKDHSYQAFKAYSDGSVAYPAAGSNGTSIRIARVMPQTT
jgi:hypothetical protein